MALIALVFGSIWNIFPQFYTQHLIFAIFHHLLAFLTIFLMLLTSWASPGKVESPSKDGIDVESQRCDIALSNSQMLDSQKCTVNIGKV
jgi:hypothetical protein